MTLKNEMVKVEFRLEPDEDGYPPVAAETVWAHKTGRSGEFTINNVPFFATQATIGDTVAAERVAGVLTFQSVVNYGGHSLVRVLCRNDANREIVRSKLRGIGCDLEFSEQYGLFAVDVPPSVRFRDVQSLLETMQGSLDIDFEEPITYDD